MDALEAECGSLADSLLQGQVMFKEEDDDKDVNEDDDKRVKDDDDEGVKEDHGNDYILRMDLTSCFSSR